MDVILDTHALVWILQGHPRIGTSQAALIEDPANRIIISPVSVYEIANKHRIGRMPDAAPTLKLAEGGFSAFDWQHLPLTLQHAHLAAEIDHPHRGPFDRLIAAQSIIENIPVMTVDAAIGELGAKVVW